MDNFDLKKYLAEGKLLKEYAPDISLYDENNRINAAITRFVRKAIDDGKTRDQILDIIITRAKDGIEKWQRSKKDTGKGRVNEGIFGTSYEKELKRIYKAIDRFVQKRMDYGGVGVLDTIQNILRNIAKDEIRRYDRTKRGLYVVKK